MKQTEVCVVDTFTTCYAQIKVLARVTVHKIALPIRLLSGEKRDEKPRFSKGFCLFILMALMELERKFAAAFVLHSKEVKENCSTFPTLSCVPISHAVSRSGHVAFCALLFAFSLIAGEIALTHELSRGTLHSSSPLAPPSPVSLQMESNADAVRNLTALQTLLCLTFSLHCQNAEFSQLFSSKQLYCKLSVHMKSGQHCVRQSCFDDNE